MHCVSKTTPSVPNGDHRAIVRNVEMENITSSASPRVMFVRGHEGAVIDDLRIRNSKFQGIAYSGIFDTPARFAPDSHGARHTPESVHQEARR